jgi:hypothetical protein
MTYNFAHNRMEKPEADMTDGEVLSYRKFPAHITISQMRAEIAWHQSPNFKRGA